MFSIFNIHQTTDDYFHESERLMTRWIIILVFLSLLAINYQNSSTTINIISFVLAISYISLNILQGFFIKYKSSYMVYFKNIFLYTDSILAVFMIMVVHDVLAFFYPLLLLMVISTGMRYGYKLMMKNTSLILILFTVGVFNIDYWRENLYLTFSFYLMLLLIPIYIKNLIQKIEKINQDLHHLATIDSLTGLNNRTGLIKQIEEINSRSKRNQQSFGVFYLDLDNFKKVNDTQGHKAGDALLAEIAYNLKHSFRSEDHLFRLGGDEFVIITEATETLSSAKKVADKISLAVKSAAEIMAPQAQVSSSIGIVLASPSEHLVDPKTLLQWADDAMYNSKKFGKNRYSFSDKQLSLL